jgi:hypothetical protein
MKTRYEIKATIYVEAPTFREAFEQAGAWLARGTDDTHDAIDRDSDWSIRNLGPATRETIEA